MCALVREWVWCVGVVGGCVGVSVCVCGCVRVVSVCVCVRVESVCAGNLRYSLLTGSQIRANC